ncbi:branched-chain amino acid transport system permease protein [Desulfovibrionales bacterium]
MNKHLILALASMVLLTLPAIASDYVIHVGTLIMVYMILAMGLNVLPGFCGLLDLGYVGFYGIGAYTTGILTITTGLNFWVIIPLTAINGALWGVLLGTPTLRLTGDYFAIATFGFSELIVLFLTNEIWLTRGPLGLPGIDPVSIDFSWLNQKWYYEFTSETPYFYLGIALVVLIYLVMRRIEDSRLGRAWLAIREDSLAAASCGVSILRYKTIAFATLAGTGAVGGAFFARWHSFISPDMFKFWESFLVLCMCVLGGLGSIQGSLFGAVVFVAMGELLRPDLLESLMTLSVWPEVFRTNTSNLLKNIELSQVRFLTYGLLMIIIIRFKPNGFLPKSSKSGLDTPLLIPWRRKIEAGKI